MMKKTLKSRFFFLSFSVFFFTFMFQILSLESLIVRQVAQLTLFSSDNRRIEAVHPLFVGDNVIGSGEGSTVRIDGRVGISRRHATIQLVNLDSGRMAKLIDHGSRNKTYLLGQNNVNRKKNYQLIPEERNQLLSQDYFALADSVFSVRISKSEQFHHSRFGLTLQNLLTSVFSVSLSLLFVLSVFSRP